MESKQHFIRWCPDPPTSKGRGVGETVVHCTVSNDSFARCRNTRCGHRQITFATSVVVVVLFSTVFLFLFVSSPLQQMKMNICSYLLYLHDLTLCTDPLEWSREHVAGWLHWLIGQCELEVRRGPAELERLVTLNGRQLSRLSRDDIAQLTRNPRLADMIWTSFNLLLSTANGADRARSGNRPLLHAKLRCNYHHQLLNYDVNLTCHCMGLSLILGLDSLKNKQNTAKSKTEVTTLFTIRDVRVL